MKFIRVLFIGLIVYIALIIGFGTVYFFFDLINGSNSSTPVQFWDCIYFSSTTFGTIGFGDFLPSTQSAKALVILQSVISIIYIGVFSGYMAYHFLKRPQDIFITEKIHLSPNNGHLLFSIRVGNRGVALIDCKLDISILQIIDDVKRTIFRKEISYTILEKTWSPNINLSSPKEAIFFENFKIFYRYKDSSLIRILVSGTDINTGEKIATFRYFLNSDIAFSGKFIDVYHWVKTKRTQPKWGNFNKALKLSNEEISEILSLLK